MKTVRQRYLDSKNGDLTRYAGMIGEEFRSQIDRLSQIIGAAHEPSIGAYKEGLLRSCIKHYLPKRYSAGTGFVVFTRKSPRAEAAGENVDILNLREHEVSSQLDIIVFDDLNYATIFRDDDFAVVRPEAVKAIIEVKGFLRRNDIGGIVDKYIKLGQQFVDYGNYRRQYEEIEVMRFPGLLLMAWNVYVDRHGHPQCDGKILRKALVGAYRKKLSSDRLNPNVFPLLNSAYTYDDCIVQLTRYTDDGENRYGYYTARGKFVRYDEANQPSLDRDCTISNLLALIYVHLDVPFNQDFAYYDQSISTEVLPHPLTGMTDLMTEAERA